MNTVTVIRSPLVRLFLAVLVWAPLLTDEAAGQLDEQAFDAYARAGLDSFAVPGMSVAIVKDGEMVLAKGYGVRHLEQGGTVDEHTLFAIASNTKAFIATMLAQLVDEDSLDWDDPVRDYLPGFALYDAYASADMRVRDLLSHRSGLGTFSGDLIWYGDGYSTDEVVRRIRYVPQTSPFRSRYGYSNLMFITAGQLLESVSGQSWDERVKSRIFGPIGMRRTVTSTSDLPDMENVAQPHKWSDGATIPLDWYNWDAAGATGGIISSASDMIQWVQLHLDRGVWEGDTLFSVDASYEMWSPQTVVPIFRSEMEFLPDIHFRAYGLGFFLNDYKGRKVVTHGGGYDGMFSRVTMVPEENLGIVILTNGMTSLQTALTYHLLDVFLGPSDRDWVGDYAERMRKDRLRKADRLARRKAERVTGTEPSKPLDGYAGLYSGAMYGDVRVRHDAEGLVLEMLANKDLVADLSHWHYDTFRLEWRKELAWFEGGWVQFLMDMNGGVVEMKMDVPNEDFWFEELELKRKE